MKNQIPTIRSFVQTACQFWPAVLSALLLCVSSASAQVLTWDPGKTASVNGNGTGTWSTTAGTKNPANWYNGSADVVWADANVASIGSSAGAAGAISLKVNVSVNSITFNQTSSGGYTVSGSATLANTSGTNEVDNTAGSTIYTHIVLAGSAGFTKTGAGTLVLSSMGTPLFTGGPLHVAAGTLQLAGSDWVYSSADLSVDSGATFDLDDENASVGALIGAGTVNNSHASSKILTIGGNGNNDNGEFDGNIESTGAAADLTVVKNGTGVEIFGGASTYTGPTIVTNGTLLVNGIGSLSTGGVNVSSTGTFGGTGSVGGKVTYNSGALAEFSTTTPMTISGALVAAGNTVELNLPANLADNTYVLANYNLTGSSGTFAITPTVLTGSYADAGAIATISTNAGQVILTVAPCTAAGISQNPVSATAFIGNTATFSVTATGSTPTYDWQVNSGSGFADVSGGTGQGTPTYTTPTLTGAENGWTYHCVVSVACDTSSQTSTAATLTEVNPANYSFRSITSGNWSSPSTWQQSPDGVTWSAASATPFSGNSNILVQAGNIVTVTAPVTIDHTVIQAGGEVDVSGTTLTITGASTPDVDVSGNLELLDAAGSTVAESGTPSVVFENGGAFVSQLHTATAVPTATWAANSTCSISPASAGAAVPTGLTGQAFGNFVWNWPTQNGSVNLAGALTSVAGNLTVAPHSTLDLTTVGDATTYTLTVGGLIDIQNGGGGKLAVAGGGPTGNETIQMGAGLDIESGGNFDLGNHGSNEVGGVTLEMTSNSQFTVSGALLNPQSGSYLIDAGHTLTLNNSIAINAGRSVTVNGTLNFQTSQVTAGNTNGGALVINSTGTIEGNGTGQLTTGLGSVTYGGTLNINQASLTGLTSGQSILLFGASSYTPSTEFTTIIPATPPGFASWDTSQMDVSGSLVVSGTVIVSPKITSTVLAGGNLTLSGTGAPVSDGFTVYGSASLTTPRSSWTSTGVTGTSDGSGNFSAVITGATGAGASQFYTILFN